MKFIQPEKTMTTKRVKLAVLTTLVCVSASLAMQTISAQATGPSSNVGQLSDFLGDGQCTGQFMAMGKTPGHATTARFHGEKILDGNWIVIHYDEDQTAANPQPFHIVQYVGYDSAKKQFVGVGFDNLGSSYGAGTSAGWKGDTIIFDNAPTDGMANRDTFTRNGASELTHASTIQDKNKKWIKTDEETCHKS
jgi:Protein of unknown function (DUF1579)